VSVFLVSYLNYELPRPLGQGLNEKDESPRDFATPAAWRNRGGVNAKLIFPGLTRLAAKREPGAIQSINFMDTH